MKVTIYFYGETPRDIDRPLDGDTRGDFRSHSKEVVVHASMDDFHRRLVSGVTVTAACVLAILTVNRYKKCEILLALSSKYRSDRSDIMEARIVSDIITKEKATKQVSFVDEQVDTVQDVSMPWTFLSNHRNFSTTEEDLRERWGISISQDALTLESITQKLTRY